MALSAFCLTVIFVLVAFASGYGFGVFIGQANADPAVFVNGVFKAVHPHDGIGFLVKCLLPALSTGVICSTEGLSVEGGVAEVPLQPSGRWPVLSAPFSLRPRLCPC